MGAFLSRQTFFLTLVPLPVAAPITIRQRAGTLGHDVSEYLAIRPTARVLAVGRFVGVVGEVQISELVDLVVLHTAKTGKVGFSEVAVA